MLSEEQYSAHGQKCEENESAPRRPETASATVIVMRVVVICHVTILPIFQRVPFSRSVPDMSPKFNFRFGGLRAWGACSSNARSDWRAIHHAATIENRQPSNRNARKNVTSDRPVVAYAIQANAHIMAAHRAIAFRYRIAATPYTGASFMRLSSAEFTTTDRELNAMAAAAIIGLRNPNAATGMPMAL